MSSDECGEIFFGYAPPWQISGVDFSVPRVCDLPKDHNGKHWYKEDPPRPEVKMSARWHAFQEWKRNNEDL
jgi:hypothetical protein